MNFDTSKFINEYFLPNSLNTLAIAPKFSLVELWSITLKFISNFFKS